MSDEHEICRPTPSPAGSLMTEFDFAAWDEQDRLTTVTLTESARPIDSLASWIAARQVCNQDEVKPLRSLNGKRISGGSLLYFQIPSKYLEVKCSKSKQGIWKVYTGEIGQFTLTIKPRAPKRSRSNDEALDSSTSVSASHVPVSVSASASPVPASIVRTSKEEMRRNMIYLKKLVDSDCYLDAYQQSVMCALNVRPAFTPYIGRRPTVYCEYVEAQGYGMIEADNNFLDENNRIEGDFWTYRLALYQLQRNFFIMLESFPATQKRLLGTSVTSVKTVPYSYNCVLRCSDEIMREVRGILKTPALTAEREDFKIRASANLAFHLG